jgi:hypothetical protein
MSRDGKLALGYLRNAAEITLLKPEKPAKWSVEVTGSHIRRRKAATAQVQWDLPADRYLLTVWDLDTGQKAELSAAKTGEWRQEQTDHDFVLLWR